MGFAGSGRGEGISAKAALAEAAAARLVSVFSGVRRDSIEMGCAGGDSGFDGGPDTAGGGEVRCVVSGEEEEEEEEEGVADRGPGSVVRT